MEKIKEEFVFELPERHWSGHEAELDTELRICAKFILKALLDKMDALDPQHRIPIEDTSLVISRADKSVTVVISLPRERAEELKASAAATWKELLASIERWGVDSMIAAGRKAGY